MTGSHEILLPGCVPPTGVHTGSVGGAPFHLPSLLRGIYDQVS